MTKKHKGLSFEVEDSDFSDFSEAVVNAVARSAATGKKVRVDVITNSRSAARAWAGDHGAEVYDEDPEASVHERIVIQAESLGRIA